MTDAVCTAHFDATAAAAADMTNAPTGHGGGVRSSVRPKGFEPLTS